MSLVRQLSGNASLPALIDRASAALSSARTSAEVLEARDMASNVYDLAKRQGRLLKAKQAHDELISAAYRAQGDALLIESQAKIRLADEYDAAKDRGEVSKQGQRTDLIPEEKKVATPGDIGLSYKEVHDARQIRNAEAADPGIVRRIVDQQVAAGHEPTKAAVREAVKWLNEEKAKKAFEKKEARFEKEQAVAAATIAASEQIGHKVYGVISADPPWRFEPYSRETGMDRAPENHYVTETTDVIASMKVPAAENCVLFLWATAPMLLDAIEVMKAWGFTYKSNIVWAKDRIGTGYWVRNKHEHLLIGVKGNIPAPSAGTQSESVITASVTVHSAKPAIFAEEIERLFPSIPKLEMFCRSPRPGWDSWGNEVGNVESSSEEIAA